MKDNATWRQKSFLLQHLLMKHWHQTSVTYRELTWAGTATAVLKIMSDSINFLNLEGTETTCCLLQLNQMTGFFGVSTSVFYFAGLFFPSFFSLYLATIHPSLQEVELISVTCLWSFHWWLSTSWDLSTLPWLPTRSIHGDERPAGVQDKKNHDEEKEEEEKKGKGRREIRS